MQIDKSTIPLDYGLIYKITNKLNNKPYIGQTIDVKRRVIKYNALRCKRQIKLYNALVKYGVDNFLFDIIDHTSNQKLLDDLETMYIEKFDSINNGYNLQKGGHSGRHSDETKLKMSLIRRGNKHEFFGKKHKEESKRMISESLKVTWKEKGGGPNKGRKFSEETKKRMSEAHIKRFTSPVL